MTDILNLKVNGQWVGIPALKGEKGDPGEDAEVTSESIISALGYTPYSSSNPNGYTSNTGTVTSVNNTSPINGNVSLTASDIGAQETLVSGTNIKTINNTSLLGSGNIDIQGGGGSYTAGTGLDLQSNEFSIIQNEGVVATVVGTLTELDGVYSGFSTSNYLQLPKLTIGSEDTYEIQLKFTLTSVSASYLYGDSQIDYSACIGYVGNGLYKSFVVPNGAANNNSFSYSANTPYWVRITRTVSSGSYATTVTISTDGTNWTQFGSTDTKSGTQPATTFNLTLGAQILAGGLQGSIDINGCYIKKNDVDWWNPSVLGGKIVAKATNELYGLVKSGVAMPSNTYEDLTLGASGTDYTAPANGWISFVKQATGNQFIQFNNVTAGWFNNVNSASNGQYISIICPVKKGDIFQISYNTGGGTAQFIFIYAVGSESEAS